MGVSIYATNSKYEFDMWYFGFFRLRSEIACALDAEFGEHYRRLFYFNTPSDLMDHDRVADLIIKKNGLEEKGADIIDFLYESDTNGEISYKTCGKIYELIKDLDFGKKGFRYGAYSKNDYEEFKAFLKDCYSKKKKMRWS